MPHYNSTELPPPPEALGRYRIVRELGRGAMGVVYEGLDPVIGRRVAIKTARRDVLESSGHAEELMQRFLREARAAGTLNHPNIITIYDANEEKGVAYIAMEYIESGTLLDLMVRKSRMSPEKVVEVGAAICQALATAHDQGIVHRDIKPANIMMLADGAVKVADFGIAHVSDSELTQEGAIIGTPHFMSPEQFMGQRVDGRSDLFSVGVIVYELLTGERPFTGEALSTIMHQVIKADPIAPQELNYAVPDALSQVVMKTLAKRPGERYQSGRAMAAALLEAVKPNPDPAVLALGSAAPSDEGATLVLDKDQATIASTTLPDGSRPDAPRSRSGRPEVDIPDIPAQPRPTEAGGKGKLESTFTLVRPSLLMPAGVAVGVILILVVLAASMLSGDGETGPQTSPTATGTPGTAVPGQGSPPGGANAISSIVLTVWYADSDEAALILSDDSNTDTDKFRVHGKPGRADIEVRDGQGAILAQQEGFEEGKISLSSPSPEVPVTLKSPGYEDQTKTYLAKTPNQAL